MYRTRNDLPIDTRSKMIAILNSRLADVIDLRTQAKVAHRNMKGLQFVPLHDLFDRVAEDLDGYADLIAERAVQLGGVARETARQVAASTISRSTRRLATWKSTSLRLQARLPPLGGRSGT